MSSAAQKLCQFIRGFPYPDTPTYYKWSHLNRILNDVAYDIRLYPTASNMHLRICREWIAFWADQAGITLQYEARVSLAQNLLQKAQARV